jgi:4-amino-4-deoxy-L-arabinose transferase-like glycosyltransferase
MFGEGSFWTSLVGAAILTSIWLAIMLVSIALVYWLTRRVFENGNPPRSGFIDPTADVHDT